MASRRKIDTPIHAGAANSELILKIMDLKQV
jgi:hypothetical protein